MNRLSANALKLAAALCMALDHTAFLFLPPGSAPYVLLRFLGKLAIPVFCFLVAEGCAHTRDIRRYFLRLAGLALVSHLPFSWMYHGGTGVSVEPTSVGFTLLCGAVAIWSWQRLTNRGLALVSVLICIAVTFWSDWSFFGVLWVWTFWLYREDPKKQAAMFAVLALLRIGVQIFNFGLLPLTGWIYMLGLLPAAALPFVYNGARGRGGAVAKWGFYAWYPFHMLALTVLYVLTR